MKHMSSQPLTVNLKVSPGSPCTVYPAEVHASVLSLHIMYDESAKLYLVLEMGVLETVGMKHNPASICQLGFCCSVVLLQLVPLHFAHSVFHSGPTLKNHIAFGSHDIESGHLVHSNEVF